MTVVVDTGIWSLALRRKPPSLSATEQVLVALLSDLIKEGRVRLIGLVRQEALSGIALEEQFARVRDALAEFPDEPIGANDHVRAAEMFNRCRGAGVQGTHTDFLLCAIAERLGAEIFTGDRDFESYAKQVPVSLFRPHPET
jgi:predicted nucleic acid-binding protein